MGNLAGDVEPESINWTAKLADYAWGLVTATVAGFGAAMIYLFRRLSGDEAKLAGHEARLAALEGHHADRTQQLNEIDRKMDNNFHVMLSRLDTLRSDFRADLRVSTDRVLNSVPPK